MAERLSPRPENELNTRKAIKTAPVGDASSPEKCLYSSLKRAVFIATKIILGSISSLKIRLLKGKDPSVRLIRMFGQRYSGV